MRTSVLSKAVMLECAQSWVTAALSLLSVRSSSCNVRACSNTRNMYLPQKNEGVPVLKACIRLLRLIFTTATGIPEFQRQVSTPNVPKFSAALISLAEKHEDIELKVRSEPLDPGSL